MTHLKIFDHSDQLKRSRQPLLTTIDQRAQTRRMRAIHRSHAEGRFARFWVWLIAPLI